MKAILTLSLSLITCALFGQISFYGGGNMTVIPTLVETYMPPINDGTGFSTTGPGYRLEESYDSRVGFQFGLRYTRNITSKINLTGGLGFSSIRFKRDNSLMYDEPSVFHYRIRRTAGKYRKWVPINPQNKYPEYCG